MIISRESARAKLGIAADEFYVLSFGGSLGAEYVNEAMLAAMKVLGKRYPEMRFLHASGKRDYDNCCAQFEAMGLNQLANCNLSEYIYDMPLQMAAADLVICRAGAMTLSELAKMKKSAILIPSPNVTDNHQYVNAKTVADAGAAILVEEKTLANGALRIEAEKLLTDPVRMQRIEACVGQLADLDSNRLIWEDIQRLLGRK